MLFVSFYLCRAPCLGSGCNGLSLGCSRLRTCGFSLFNSNHFDGENQRAEGLDFADAFILNSCAVTAEAEKKSRQTVAKMVKLNPDCKIYVIGCASQSNPVQFEKYSSVRFIKGVAGKTKIVEAIVKDLSGAEIDELPAAYEYTVPAQKTKTRQTIKIQDGCNNFCSYCLIPYLRGRNRSRQISDILNEVNKAKDSVNEIVLTGIDISSYGKDIGTNLSELIKNLENIGVRLRLGSLEANVINRDFLTVLSQNKWFCQHFHLSLQSGSDRVLKKMNRHYSTQEYFEKVRLIKEFFPDANVTTDVIVGFPGETDEMFDETCGFVKKVGFGDIHVFPYSARKGTVASKFPQVDAETKKKRAEILGSIKLQLKREFLTSFLNKKLYVLTEEVHNDKICGYTHNYLKVYLDKNTVKENTEYLVLLKDFFEDGLSGEVIYE